MVVPVCVLDLTMPSKHFNSAVTFVKMLKQLILSEHDLIVLSSVDCGHYMQIA